MDTLLVGEFTDERRTAFDRAADRAGYGAHEAKTVAEAYEWLRSNPAPKAIFAHHAIDVRAFVAWVRGQAALFTVPVVVAVPAAGEQLFHRAHCDGADDAFVEWDDGAMTRRLANLVEFDPAERPKVTQGECLIASSHQARRRVLGRIVRQAGFDVRFAMNGDELEAAGKDATLIVAEAGLPGGERFGWVREKGSTPAIVLAKGDLVRAVRGTLKDQNCSVGELSAPPDHLLFQANELLRPEVANVRASRRVLHGTICTFRPKGSLEPAFALTYNFSREGLYVRTLDPPARGTDLWLEVRLPFRREAAHIRGKVVWSTGPHRPGGTTPPGFGLRVMAADSPPGDLAEYRAAYADLLEHQDIDLAQVA